MSPGLQLLWSVGRVKDLAAGNRPAFCDILHMERAVEQQLECSRVSPSPCGRAGEPYLSLRWVLGARVRNHHRWDRLPRWNYRSPHLLGR